MITTKRIELSSLAFVALFSIATIGCGSDSTEPAPVDAGADMAPEVDAGNADAEVDAGPVTVTRDEVLKWVDPFIGTTGIGFANGAMTPAAQAPLGMVRVGPDSTSGGSHGTAASRFGGYDAKDPHVRGFSHFHFVGTGVADYGMMRVLPADRAQLEGESRRRWFAEFVEEEASPGTYRAMLAAPDVEVELAAGIRAAIHRYRFDSEGDNLLLLDPAASITDSGIVASSWRLEGNLWTAEITYRGPYVGRRLAMPIWVAIELSSEPARLESWDDRTRSFVEPQFAGGSGEEAAALLTFDEAEVTLRVGVSLIDAAGALQNMEEETSDGFDALVARTQEAWRDELGKIEVTGGSDLERTLFYTALYNSFRMPTRFDERGRYRGLDGTVHDLAPGQGRYFTDLSLWDTYRTLHPLWTLVAPDAQRDALASLNRMAEDGGYMPRWPAGLSYTGGMEGEPAAILFGESAQKGLDGVDYQAAYDSLSAVADASPPQDAIYGAREGIERYIELGWIPADEIGSSASNTLEWALADHALGGLAGYLGEDEAAMRYTARGESWRQIYREEEGFFWPRNADGTWAELPTLLGYYDRSGVFVEGSPWHYRFHVQHDPEGLAELMGQAALAERLEEFFDKAKLFEGDRRALLLPDVYYWHTNQPSLGSVVNFAAADRVDRLSYWTRQIQYVGYTTDADGLAGNDDGGTLSAWFVWSAMGLYPLVGTDRYSVMPPLFERMTIELEGGGQLVVEAPGAAREVGSIESVTLDGEEVGPLELRHADLVDGATLRYQLGPFEE